MIFISHSVKDIELIKALNTFLISLNVNQNDIFCSSIEGQGVKNGERISDKISNAINNSKIIIYVITNNFIRSTFCTQELGAGWVLKKDKQFFIFKSEDVNPSDLKGFINSEYKYSTFDSSGLSSLSDSICNLYNLSISHSLVNNAINSFLEKARIETSILVEDKDKTAEEIKRKQISNLEKQYKYLAIGAKKIIANIYYSYEGVCYYSLSNGVIGSLETKMFIRRTTGLSTPNMSFAFELQPWVIDFINKNKKVADELNELMKSKNTPTPYDPYDIF